MAYSYAVDYYDQGTEQYSQLYDPGAIATPTPAPERNIDASGSSASPSSVGVTRPPSDIFTASSEVSEQEAIDREQSLGHPAISSRGGRHDIRGGRQRGTKLAAARPQHQQRQQVEKAPPKSTQTYEAAFPSLVANGVTPANGVIPTRRWNAALATRKLRTDAPSWSPGQAADSFTTLSLQARMAKEQRLAKESSASALADDHDEIGDAAAPLDPPKAIASVIIEKMNDSNADSSQKAGMSWSTVARKGVKNATD